MTLNKIINLLFILGLSIILSIGFSYWYFFKTDNRLTINDFQPKSQLITEKHLIQRAKFPVFDTHIHLQDSNLSADEVIEIMDACNIEKLLNLEIYGLWGEKLKMQIAKYQNKYPNRIMTATNIDFENIDDPDFSAKTVEQLEDSYLLGARAIKVWRNLGLEVRDSKGELVRIDDPRLDPVWEKAGELNMPVIFHIADASAFWNPPDKYNEKYLEMQAHHNNWGMRWGKFGPIFRTLTGLFYKLSIMRRPERLYFHTAFNWIGDYFPYKEQLIKERDNVIKRHPHTIFVGAHIGSFAEDLAFVAKELDEMPNFYLDMSYKIPELGRQPYSARNFFVKYQDRITFALDGPPDSVAYRDSFRFLETKDEYFDYPRAKKMPQGFWKIYGLGLPDDILRKIYYENARSIFSAGFKW